VAIDKISSTVRLRFAAISGRVYQVQRASDIEGPWTTLSTQTAPTTGMIEYLDGTRPAGSTFYRVRSE
jgi:hypothetical protein